MNTGRMSTRLPDKNFIAKMRTLVMSGKNLKNYFKSRKYETQKAIVVLGLFSIALFSVPYNTGKTEAASLDDLNGQINQVSKQLDAERGEAQTIQNQIDIIDGQTQQLQLEMQATQIQIDQTVAAINDLNQQIADAQNKLHQQQIVLGEYLRVIYEESNISPIEQIAGASSLSDFVDQSEYLQIMQQKVKDTLDQIKRIQDELKAKKADLDKKKTNLDVLQKQQTLKKQSLDAQAALKNQLLAQANANATGLQGKLNNLYAQQAAMSASYGEAVMTGGSSYPYGNPPPRNLIDTPDAYGYLIGECTSYVAWKRASIGRPVPRAMGNARDWASHANGGPHPGAVAVFPYIGGYGHVAYVEAVYGNGTILISEYNWVPYSYSSRVINPYNYGTVYIN